MHRVRTKEEIILQLSSPFPGFALSLGYTRFVIVYDLHLRNVGDDLTWSVSRRRRLSFALISKAEEIPGWLSSDSLFLYISVISSFSRET